MLRSALALAAVTLVSGGASAAIVTKTIDYEYDGVKLKGFLAYDDTTTDKRPGVLVFPEWWGLNDYAKSRAKQLAALGYVAFAADLYGDGKVIDVAHPQDAQKMATELRMNLKTWRGRAQAALKQLTVQPQVDPARVGAIGYCLGGSTALQLAYTGADLKAVCTFHAALPTPTAEEAKAIKAKLLIAHGGDDKFIPEKAITAFKESLDNAKVNFLFISYPGVVHSFTVPDADKANNPGMKYDKAADEKSWKAMHDLFKERFGK
jgi:dienelactone hydrolase